MYQPYQPPGAHVAVAPTRKRYPWTAAVLALILTPFFSMLYLGRGRRAFAYLGLMVLLRMGPLFLASAGLWPKGLRFDVLFYAVLLAGAVDAYRIALRHRQEFSGPWYSRWYGMGGAFALYGVVVLCTRAFIVEAFHIPSGSMLPTLLVGDFILVNKFTYGVRLPVINVKVLDIAEPKRGEVLVFRYPGDPSLDYIQRVVAEPGDEISYRHKRLAINGERVAVEPQPDFEYAGDGYGVPVTAERFAETLGERAYSILINPTAPPVQLDFVRQFPHRSNCEFDETGFTCSVPAGHYFVMGDNRDSASDSRYWGFMPESNIVGKAFMIWWNTETPERTGMSIQ